MAVKNSGTQRRRPLLPDGASLHATRRLSMDARFRELLYAALAWLDQHHEIVNALNVFPVPDGDTGTNMLLTMKSACREITEEHTSERGRGRQGRRARRADGCARQLGRHPLADPPRHVASSLAEQSVLTGPAFAAALAEGSRIAYKGVNRPVEGTILTVVREAAAAAEAAADGRRRPGLRAHSDRAAADEAVANTPNLLPVLAQAGKVDSGGKGLFYILEGIYREVAGISVRRQAAAPAAAGLPEPAAPGQSKAIASLPPLVYGFDVQFLVEAPALDVQAIREQITAMGDCPLVEGDETLVKVHVHVPESRRAARLRGEPRLRHGRGRRKHGRHAAPDMPPGYDPLPPRFEASTPRGSAPSPRRWLRAPKASRGLA